MVNFKSKLNSKYLSPSNFDSTVFKLLVLPYENVKQTTTIFYFWDCWELVETTSERPPVRGRGADRCAGICKGILPWVVWLGWGDQADFVKPGSEKVSIL